MNIINSFSAVLTKKLTARQLEEPKREFLKTPTNVRFSNSSMNQRKRLNFAETLKCMDNANSVIHALMLTVNTNCKEKLICQVTSWLRCALSSTKKVFACTVKDANFCTPSMTWNQNYRTFKHWRKELDLPTKGIIRLAKIQVLSVFGLI